MQRKLKACAVLLAVAILIAGMPVSSAAAAVLDEKSVFLYTSGNEEGSIYYDDKPVTFYLKIENPERAAKRLSLYYTLYAKDGDVISTSPEEEFDVERNSVNIRGYTPPLKTFGRYKLKAFLNGDFGEITKELDFSYVKANAARNDFIGISCHISTGLELPQKSKGIIKGGGFGWVRDEVPWKFVETKKGTLSIPVSNKNAIEDVYESGAKILLTLDFGNPFYEDGNFPITEEGIAAYVNYCVYLVNFFRGKLGAVEIWNEPDLKNFTGIEINGTQYTKLLKAAYTAIKEADPDLPVLGGALCSLKNEFARNFLEQMIAAGACEYMDGFSFHPYIETGDYADEATEPWTTRNIFLEQFQYAKSKFAQAGKPDMPLWLTEFGATSREYTTSGYTEKEQAIEIIRGTVMAKSEPAVEKIFLYNLKNKGTDPGDGQHNYGMLDYYYNAKPSYMALSFENELMKNAEFIEKIEAPDYRTRKYTSYRFRDKNNGKNIFVMWTNRSNNSSAVLEIAKDKDSLQNAAITASEDAVPALTLHVGKNDTVKYYDMYGNELEDADRSPYTLSPEPIYVVCTPGADIKYNGGTVSIKGSNAAPGAEVSLLAVKESHPGKPVLYIKQQTVDAFGCYQFTFNADEEDIYSVYISTGDALLQENKCVEDYGIEISYYINDKPFTTLESVKAGDKIKAVLNITKQRDTAEELLFLGVLYGGDKTVIAADMSKVVWNDGNSAAVETEVTAENMEAVKELAYMLWNEKLSPIMKKIKISK